MTTALVTGTAGFIGSSISEQLLDCGYEIKGIDIFATGKQRNVDGLKDRDGFSFEEVDIRNSERVREIAEDIDYIFHQAAVASVPQSIEEPVTTTDVNCRGTATVLDAARKAGVEAVIVASTSAIYGSSEQIPKVETMPPSLESPYALSKYYAEQLAVQYSELYDIDTVALRYFNVFGPRQDPGGEYAAVIPKFIELMQSNERPVIFGDGQQSRDFVYIDDIVEANILAAENDISGKVLNIASGRQVTINELVNELNEILGTDFEPVYDDPRPGDVRHSVADLEQACTELGYEPTVRFEEGLERTVEWF